MLLDADVDIAGYADVERASGAAHDVGVACHFVLSSSVVEKV